MILRKAHRLMPGDRVNLDPLGVESWRTVSEVTVGDTIVTVVLLECSRPRSWSEARSEVQLYIDDRIEVQVYDPARP